MAETKRRRTAPPWVGRALPAGREEWLARAREVGVSALRDEIPEPAWYA